MPPDRRSVRGCEVTVAPAKDLGLLAYQLADIADHYQQVAQNYYKELHDYGTGELYTSTEVHMISTIEENPGITAAKIAESTYRTKSAVSQMLTKLEGKGLIYKEKDPNNGKQLFLFVTPKGKHLSLCHRAYDEKNIPLDEMIELFGRDAVEKYADITAYMIRYMQRQRK